MIDLLPNEESTRGTKYADPEHHKSLEKIKMALHGGRLTTQLNLVSVNVS